MKANSREFGLFRNWPTSFTCLNATQFLGALNDNFFRGLILYLLLDLSPPEAKARIAAVVGITFLLPFLLLSSWAGRLADRYSKRRIIVLAKVAEIVVMGFGAIALHQRSFVLSLAVLAAMAGQSAFFGPSKYGIVPEIVPRATIARANGWLAMYTNIAIVTGTGLAGLLRRKGVDVATGGLLCIALAALGTLMSLGIARTAPQSGDKALHWRFWRDLIKNWTRAGQYGHLQSILVAYFGSFYIAGFTQANMVPYAVEAMHRSDAAGNYLFAYTAIGIGIGAGISGFVNRTAPKLHHIPAAFVYSGLGLAGLALFPENITLVLLSLQVIGLCMGFFIVPAETYLQITAPDEDRGEILATANFLSFSGALMASLTLYYFDVVLQRTPQQGFGSYSLFAAVAGFLLWRKLGIKSIHKKGKNS